MTVKLRYMSPDAEKRYDQMSRDFRFACAVVSSWCSVVENIEAMRLLAQRSALAGMAWRVQSTAAGSLN